MDTAAILATFFGSLGISAAAFVAHRRLAGSGERPGCISMGFFVIGWLGTIAALITGLFLIAGR